MSTFLIGGTGPMPIPVVSIPSKRYYKVIQQVDPSVIVLLLPAGGLLHMDWTMRRLEERIKRLANPDEPIYIVGHSQGGDHAGWIAARNSDWVAKAVGVYPAWHGSKVTPGEGAFSKAPICQWLCPDSPRLAAVREEVVGVLGQRMINIISPADGIVIPFHSGYLPGTRNVMIGTAEDFEKHQSRFPGLVHLPNEWSPKHLHIGMPNLIQGICSELGRSESVVPQPRLSLDVAVSASP